MVSRRTFISALALLSSAGAVRAHTPFGQWVVYRKKHLLIGAHRADPSTYKLAKLLTSILGHHLPDAKSRVARAPNSQRLASLLGTDQLDVAVLSHADAEAIRKGEGKFAPYGEIALNDLLDLGKYVLVAHERFPERHSELVIAALADSELGPIAEE